MFAHCNHNVYHRGLKAFRLNIFFKVGSSWKRCETFLSNVREKAASLTCSILSGWEDGWMLRVQQHEWTSCSELHLSSGRFGACWFTQSPAEGAVTSHSCHVAPRWDHRNSGCVAQCEKKKGNVELLWLMLVWSFTPFFILNYSLFLPAAGGSHLFKCFHHQTPEQTERENKTIQLI